MFSWIGVIEEKVIGLATTCVIDFLYKLRDLLEINFKLGNLQF